MLSKDTRSIMKSMLGINNSMIIETPAIYGKDEFNSIFYRMNTSQLETSDIDEFGIFDCTSFLSALDLLESPEIKREGNLIVAKDENSVMKFVTSDVSSLEDIQINPKVIESTLAVDSVLEFTFGVQALTKIKKASATFKTFDTVFIIKDKDGLQLKLGTKDSFTKSNNSFGMKFETDIDNSSDFEIALPMESLLKIPSMEYSFKIKYNEAKDSYRVVLDNSILTFVMSLMT